MFYPASVLGIAIVITAVIMIFVIPEFKKVFSSFGADLPAPTLVVIAISDAFVQYSWLALIAVGGFDRLRLHAGSARLRCRSQSTACCCACR
jgi:type IV pilus assembly protein PilC